MHETQVLIESLPKQSLQRLEALNAFGVALAAERKKYQNMLQAIEKQSNDMMNKQKNIVGDVVCVAVNCKMQPLEFIQGPWLIGRITLFNEDNNGTIGMEILSDDTATSSTHLFKITDVVLQTIGDAKEAKALQNKFDVLHMRPNPCNYSSMQQPIDSAIGRVLKQHMFAKYEQEVLKINEKKNDN